MKTKEDRIIEAAFQMFFSYGYRKAGMSDIADAANMSRPSLYASFANKGAIFSEMVGRQSQRNLAATRERLHLVNGLHERLACVFDIWVIEPASTVINSENATELLASCAEFAPRAVADLYDEMEAQLVAVLEPEVDGASPLQAAKVARILRLATSGIKASAGNLPDLREAINGLICMVVVTVRRPA